MSDFKVNDIVFHCNSKFKILKIISCNYYLASPLDQKYIRIFGEKNIRIYLNKATNQLYKFKYEQLTLF